MTERQREEKVSGGSDKLYLPWPPLQYSLVSVQPHFKYVCWPVSTIAWEFRFVSGFCWVSEIFLESVWCLVLTFLGWDERVVLSFSSIRKTPTTYKVWLSPTDCPGRKESTDVGLGLGKDLGTVNGSPRVFCRETCRPEGSSKIQTSSRLQTTRLHRGTAIITLLWRKKPLLSGYPESIVRESILRFLWDVAHDKPWS